MSDVVVNKSSEVPSGLPKGVVLEAFGGPIQQNAPYWVGERGPELIVPKSNSDVVSTYDLEEGGGKGGDVHMALNIYGNITSDELDMAVDNAFDKAYAQVGA